MGESRGDGGNRRRDEAGIVFDAGQG